MDIQVKMLFNHLKGYRDSDIDVLSRTSMAPAFVELYLNVNVVSKPFHVDAKKDCTLRTPEGPRDTGIPGPESLRGTFTTYPRHSLHL